MNESLGELLAQIKRAIERQVSGQEEAFASEPVEDERVGPAERRRIDRLFEEAELDRSKAYELKRELDRCGLCGRRIGRAPRP